MFLVLDALSFLDNSLFLTPVSLCVFSFSFDLLHPLSWRIIKCLRLFPRSQSLSLSALSLLERVLLCCSVAICAFAFVSRCLGARTYTKVVQAARTIRHYVTREHACPDTSFPQVSRSFSGRRMPPYALPPFRGSSHTLTNSNVYKRNCVETKSYIILLFFFQPWFKITGLSSSRSVA